MNANPLEGRGRDHPWVVGVASSPDLLSFSAEAVKASCDLLEVRVDQVGDGLALRRNAFNLSRAGLPVLVTVRGEAEGGRFTGTDAERLALYEAWSDVASMFDLELSAGVDVLAKLRAIAHPRSILVMASFHDFQQTPSNSALDLLIDGAKESNVDAMKLAVTLRGPSDLERMEELVATPRNIPLCVVGMGHLGWESRISLPAAGSWLTYGYLGEANAPGQPAAADLVETLRVEHSGYAAWRR